MIYILEFLGLTSVLIAAFWAFSKASASLKAGSAVALMLTLALGSFAQPALAAAANDNALSTGQKALNEELRTDPGGVQYEGIEYPQVDGTPLSDREITARIYENVPEHLKVSVSSGAVRVSGTVEDKATAKEIVQNIREIPGVHEVSYDLGTDKEVNASR